MQIVPDNLNIRTGYHVFETPEDIVINSQMYDKFTMEPKPFNFFNLNQCLNNKNLLLYECNILEYGWTMIAREHDYQYYIIDNQDKDIFYFITEVSTSDSNQYFCKAQKIENSWKITNIFQPDSGNRWGSVSPYSEIANRDSRSTYFHYKIIGQSNNYIVLVQHHSGSSIYGERSWYADGRYQYLSYICVNKKDMSVRALDIGAYLNFSVFKIKEESDYIYLDEQLEGNHYIVKFYPETRTRQVLYSITGLGSWDSIGICNIIKFKNKYYILTRNQNANGYSFQVLDIDFEHDTVTKTTQDLPSITGFSYKKATTRNDIYDCSWLQINLKNIDDKYIAITSHDNRNYIHGYAHLFYDWWPRGNFFYTNSYTVSSAAGYHRHALVKYDEENDTWISKGIITPDTTTQHIYGMLYYDQYTPIFLLNNKILAYKLDLETEQYNKVFEASGTFNTIGLDENNKFYTFGNNNICRIYNDVTSQLLSIKFELNSYNYNGQNINTYVTIYSKNFINEYILSKVKLIIEGNCHFTENDKKELITYTEPSGPINIPVTVTNGGKVYCYIKEVE